MTWQFLGGDSNDKQFKARTQDQNLSLYIYFLQLSGLFSGFSSLFLKLIIYKLQQQISNSTLQSPGLRILKFKPQIKF
jgi:hypothetical protein